LICTSNIDDLLSVDHTGGHFDCPCALPVRITRTQSTIANAKLELFGLKIRALLAIHGRAGS